MMTPAELAWLQQGGISYNENENGASQPGNFTTSYGQLWNEAAPTYGGFNMNQGETPEAYMSRIFGAAHDPSYGTQGLTYGDLSSGNGFFSNIGRVSQGGNDYMRVGNNLSSFATDPLAMDIIKRNGGMAALTQNDPTYGTMFNVSSPGGAAAYQQLSDLGDKRHNQLNDQAWFNLVKLAAVAAGGAYMSGAGVGAAEGATAAATTAAPEAATGGTGAFDSWQGMNGVYDYSSPALGGSTSGAGGGMSDYGLYDAPMDTGADNWASQYFSNANSNPYGLYEAPPDMGADNWAPQFGGNTYSGVDGSMFQQLVQKFGTTAAQQLMKGMTGSGTSGSPLGNIFGGKGGAQDYASLLGAGGSSLLGLLGAQNQMKGMKDLQTQSLAMGAPFRQKLLESYQPGFDMASQDPAYQGAMDQASNSVLRKLAATSGNPYDNPGGVMEASKFVTQGTALPQLNAYRSQLGTAGQFGVNAAGTQGAAAVQAGGGQYDAIGSGLQQLTKQNTSLTDLAHKYNLVNGWNS